MADRPTPSERAVRNSRHCVIVKADVSEPTTEKRETNDAQRSTGYLLLGFALSWLPMPISGLAAIPLAVSLFYGIRFQRQLRAMKAPAASRRMSVIGLAMTGLLIAMVVAPLAKYQASLDYQRCMWGANTQLAKASCENEFDQHPSELTQFFMK